MQKRVTIMMGDHLDKKMSNLSKEDQRGCHST